MSGTERTTTISFEGDVPDIGAVVSAEWRGERSRSRKQTVKTYAHGQKNWTQYWNARDMSASVTQNKTAQYMRWMTTRPLKRGDVPGARLRFRAISGALSAIACFPYFLFLLFPAIFPRVPFFLRASRVDDEQSPCADEFSTRRRSSICFPPAGDHRSVESAGLHPRDVARQAVRARPRGRRL
jgi:hypothetical protein